MTGAGHGRPGRWRAGEVGEIIVGWLTRLTLVLAVAGVLAYDGIAYGVAAVGVRDIAATSARVAALDYATFSDVDSAYGAASVAASQAHAGTVVPRESFVVDGDGDVTLSARRTADTLVLRLLPRSRSWLTVEAQGSGSAR